MLTSACFRLSRKLKLSWKILTVTGVTPVLSILGVTNMWAIITPRGRIIVKHKSLERIQFSFEAGQHFDQFPKGTTIKKVG